MPGGALIDLAVLTVIAAIPRFWRLTEVGFRGDEAVYAGQSALLANVGGMDRWFIPASRGNSNFLIYQWIVSVLYRVWGLSDFIPRFVSALASTLTVLLIYSIGRQLYGRPAGILAGLCAALSAYAVGLGRLALLDATTCFFVTAALTCVVTWNRTRSDRWLFAAAALTALAMQVKVTSVLVVPIAVIAILAARSWRALNRRNVLVTLGVGLVSLTPAIIEVSTYSGQLSDFLSRSINRSSNVPASYYFTLLWNNEGPVLGTILIGSAALTVLTFRRRDALIIGWLAAYLVFLQFYPLKAFNYPLPAFPALALAVGRLGWLFRGHLSPALNRVRYATAVVLVALIAGFHFSTVQTAVNDDTSAGMREAALWLRQQGAQHAGTMTLSHGSAQYVLSYYGGIDAYPFGRFRLATVVPGGDVVTAGSNGSAVPTDWVTYWPARLIAQDKLEYLVYSTGTLDDPPEESQIGDSITQRQFRTLIQNFGGQLVHTVYWHHEARVYIYRATKTLASPSVQTDYSGGRVQVTAAGFAPNSPVTVSYHGILLGRTQSDASGAAKIDLPLPAPSQSEYHLTVADAQGDTASVTGLPSARVVFTVADGTVRLYGTRFRPNAPVTISYGAQVMSHGVASPDGTVSSSFPLPRNTHLRFRIRITDDSGQTAWATGLQPPTVAFVVNGKTANVTGTNYLPNVPVTVAYGGKTVGTPRTDATGSFKMTFGMPAGAGPALRLVATDSSGRQASVAGLVR